MAVLFLVSGTIHLLHPDIYESIVPDVLPAHRALVLLSGVAELLCAIGLLVPRTRRRAGLVSAALLLAVFPANVQMAVDAWHDWRVGAAGGWYVGVSLVRLPLQLPMIWWMWREARRT